MSVTCNVHGGEVELSDTVELPSGLDDDSTVYVCLRCYMWMEDLMETDDDEVEYYVLTFEEEE